MIVLSEKHETKNEKCPWLGSEEDHWKTTMLTITFIYPVCKCRMKHCKEYNGYCPIRDDR